jgi:uncharacterized integral membrane protein
MADGRRDTSDTIRLVVIGILVLVLAALVIDNTDDVEIGYLFGETDMPLVVVILVSAVLGALIAWLFRRARRD